MSPALRCVVSLTTLFFSVYLAAVLARFARVVAGFVMEKHLPPTQCERAIAQAADALALAPMLCVLMISIRLRAMQLGLPNGDPPSWIQSCMYAHTAAFFLRFLLDAAAAGASAGAGALQWLTRCVYISASLVLYGGCVVIAGGVVALQATAGGRTPELSAMMRCIVVMAASYVLECLVLEVLRAVDRLPADVQTKPGQAVKARLLEAEEECLGLDERAVAGRLSGGSSSGAGLEAYDKLMKALAEERRHADVRAPSAADSVFLQFPLMLCVLLVGMSLRAVQLRLQPEAWARVAMYVTTCAIVVWAVWGVAARWGCLGEAPLAPSCLRRLGLTPVVPASPDAGAGCPKVRRSVSACVSAGWVFLVAVVYSGTALVVASVFAMEAEPFRVLWPEAESVASFWVLAAGKMASIPAVSTAMRCVMLLTLLFFGTHLCLMAGRAATGPMRKWADSVLDGVQRSLAFAPMLCVMMTAVRLRAMQLGIRDPQPWAQAAMCAAASAVALQVGCSLYPIAAGDSEAGDPAETVAGKMAAVAVLAVRHAAAAALYLAVAALVTALLFMERRG